MRMILIAFVLVLACPSIMIAQTPPAIPDADRIRISSSAARPSAPSSSDAAVAFRRQRRSPLRLSQTRYVAQRNPPER
jgi:hypothetical protein